MTLPLDARKLLQAAATAAACLLALAAASSRAQAGHMLVIPGSDGYGLDSCLSDNQPCGLVIADAWCEAHGMAAAQSFGRADDVTASTGKGEAKGEAKSAALAPGAFIVNCKE